MVGRRVLNTSSDDEAERPPPKFPRQTEENVLQPVSEELDPDNWPCFVLREAVVYGKDGRTPANLLHAELEGPLMVRGKLEVDKEFRHLRKTARQKVQEIDVLDVKDFSMGIGPITIWAGGKAGWFEIRPGTAYQHIYDKISEGVTLYFFLSDLYENKKNVASEKSLQIGQIFEKYSKQIDNSMTIPQVAQLCEDNAVFLLSQMRKPGGSVRWSRTIFYRWLIDRCPEINDRYRVKTGAREAQARSSTVLNDQDVALKGQRSPGLSEVPALNKTKNRYSLPAVILKFMEELHTSGKLPRQRMSVRRLTRAIYNGFDVATESIAKLSIEAHAEPIFVGLGMRWADSPIYGELEQILSQPEIESTMRKWKANQVVLQPRNLGAGNNSTAQRPSATVKTSPTTGRQRKRSLQSQDDENSSGVEEDFEGGLGSRKHKITGRVKRRQSFADETLPQQPRLTRAKLARSPSEASHIMTTRSRSSSDGSNSPTTPENPPGRRRGPSRSGKVAALRLVGSNPALKSFSPPLSDDEIPDRRSRKKLKTSHSTNNDDSEITESSNEAPYLEAGDFDEKEVEAMEGLIIVSEPIPSSSPQGPNGLWSCQREGCEYQVAAADKPDGRANVQTHFLQHADEIAKRERLVLEESKPYLPTSHLLEMLRNLGESARLAEQRKIGGRVVPQPIKRRIVV